LHARFNLRAKIPFDRQANFQEENLMELKVVCVCGQKYKFDVEPVGGRMPFTVNCPVCGADGTATANVMLAGQFSAAPIAPPPIVPASGGLKINRHEPAPAPAPARAIPPLPSAPKPIAPVKSMAAAKPKQSGEFSMGLGILGAFLGAALGGGLVYGFYLWAGFRFPLSGVAIGALSGYGARLLARGTHTTLGIIAGVLALFSIVAVFYLIYGGFAIFGIISIIISVGLAYRIASE
jgi:hypothetical protein